MSCSEVSLVLQKMEPADLPAVVTLEQEGFPADEAANSEKMEYRVKHASHLCYVCTHVDDSKLIGFVASTGAPNDTTRMTHDMVHNHDQGNVLCIHSVVIAEQYRGKGYGRYMLKSYLDKIRNTTNIKYVLLMSKRMLVPFYESLGFEELGPSDVVLGKDQWIEMGCTL